MQKVPAIYRDGNVVLDHSVDWPDGTRIEVCPLKQESTPNNDSDKDALKALACALNDPNSYGLDESLWPKTREGIELLLAHMDAAEPLDITVEQQQAIDDERETNRRVQKELMRESWSQTEELF